MCFDDQSSTGGRQRTLIMDELPTFLLADEREILGDLTLQQQQLLQQQQAVSPPIQSTFCASGQEVQRISVISNLPELLRDNHAECMRRIVPKIREVVRVAEAEMQVASSGVFLQILERGLVPIQNYTQTFLQTILMCMENKDAEISKVWLDTLLDVIDLLPKDIVSKEILSKAVAKGQLSQPVQSRLACCKILGKAATKFEPFVIKRDILPIVLALCQDVDYEVRACMSRLLEPVARGLGLEETKTAILPELVELTNDEHSYVRLAGLDTVVSILTLLDTDAQVSTVIPLVCKYCQQALSKQDETLTAVSRHFGKLCQGLNENLTEDQKKYFIEFYRKLCRIGVSKKSEPSQATSSSKSLPFKSLPINQLPSFIDIRDQEQEDELEKCRHYAASNIPAVVAFVSPKAFRTELAATFSQLCSDCNFHVRQTVASGFHEVVIQLGPTAHQLIPDLIQLLNDNSTEVLRNGFISKLPETLDFIRRSCTSAASEAKFSEVLAALLACEAVVFSSTNWRLQEEFMSTMSSLPQCFSSDVINQKIMPLVFRKLHLARALPVKRAAARTVLLLMRSNRRLEQRKDTCCRLVQELARSRSFYERSLYIDICTMALDIYSRSFFKENFVEALIGLYDDSVPNIRLRLCHMLPRVKRSLRLPTDKALSVLLENCVSKMRASEKDRDVIAAWVKATSEMDTEPVQTETNANSRHRPKDDIDDEKKLEEENRLLELEDQEKREQDKSKDKLKERRDSKLPKPKTGMTSITKTTTQSTPSLATPAAPPTSTNAKDARKSLVISAKAGGSGKVASRTTSVPNSLSTIPHSPAPGSSPTSISRKNSTPGLSGSPSTGSPVKRMSSSVESKKTTHVIQRRTSVGAPSPSKKT